MGVSYKGENMISYLPSSLFMGYSGGGGGAKRTQKGVSEGWQKKS